VACFIGTVAQAQQDYERPPKLTPQQALGDIAVKTTLYEIGGEVLNDGISNHFYIFSGSDAYSVECNELAIERIREIGVIDHLGQIRRGEAFADGVKKAAQGTLESAKTLITQPLRTVGNAPQGVRRFFSNAYQTTKRDPKSQYEDAAYKEAIGFSAVKRNLASELMVDVYSSNEQLQRELDEVAWTSYAGGVSLAALRTAALPTSIGRPVSAGKTAVRVSQIVQEETPQNLERRNREQLQTIGATASQIEALVQNPWYSPRRQTALTEALYALRSVRGIAGYLDRAVTAASESEAYFMHRSAELLEELHTTQKPLTELYMGSGLPVAETKEGGLAAAFAIDHLIWSERVDRATAGLRDELPAKHKETPVVVWVGGTASERAKTHLAKRGLTVQEHALEQLIRAK